MMKFDLSDVSFDDQENPGNPTDVTAMSKAPTCSHEGNTFKVSDSETGGFAKINFNSINCSLTYLNHKIRLFIVDV